MAKAGASFAEAKEAFEDADEDGVERMQERTCGTATPDGPCAARGVYVERFRGTKYHFHGTCSAGHEIERYGYAEAVS